MFADFKFKELIWKYLIQFVLECFVFWIPIPEETMVPIYYLLGRYPHVLIGILFSFNISFFISMMELDHLGFSVCQFADNYFLLFSFIIFTRVLVDEEKMKITIKELDERSLQMELIDLV